MKIRTLALTLALVISFAARARAVSLTLQGQGGASLEDAGSSVLYASDSDGASVLITAVGLPAPNGGTFSELGVPSMMPDGREISVLEVLNDNTPFLFDSTIAELAEQGIEVTLVAHPIIAVERDDQGKLLRFYGEALPEGAKGEREKA